jgi:tetratricopeptide (TPR) repeat protein
MRTPGGLWGISLFLLAALVLGTGDARGQARTGGESEGQLKLKEALELFAQGKVADAEPAFREAIRLDPFLVDAHEKYSALLFAKKEFKKGEEVARNGLRHLPGAEVLKLWVGMHLFQQGAARQKLAYQYLKEAWKVAPDRFEIQGVAGPCCLQNGDYPCAVASIENYLSHRPSKLASRDYLFQVLLATAELKRGKLDRAARAVEQVIRVKPDYVAAQVVMAELLLRRGDCSRAVAAYERLRRQPPQAVPLLHLQLGQAYLCTRRYQQAAAEAESYLRGHPNDVEGLFLRGDAARFMRRYDLAVNAYRAVLARGASPREVRFRLAQVYSETRQHRRVLQELAEELRQSPRPAALVLALRSSVRLNDKAQALQHAEALLKVADNNAEANYYAGIAHSSAGDFERAIPLFEKTLSLNPKHLGAREEMVRALCYQARGAFRKQQVAEALRLVKRAQSYNPQSLVVNQNLALLYLTTGKHKTALAHLQMVLRKVPNDYQANRLAGRALTLLGRYREAQVRFDVALASVQSHGGIGYARVLGEAAASRLSQGEIDRSAVELDRAIEEVQRSGASEAALLTELRRNAAKVYLLKAPRALGRGQEKEAWLFYQRAQKESAALPPDEAMMVKVAVAFGALASGQNAEGRELGKKLRGKMGKVLLPPYDKIGDGFFEAYADYSAPGADQKMKAAAKFDKLAALVPSPTRDKLRRLARNAYAQAGAQLYRQGKTRQALLALNKAVGPSRKEASPQLLHNMAVVTGGAQGAVATLEALKDKVPMALCNLAVHYEATDPRKAFDLFKQCDRRGANYPGLKEIISSKKRIYGEEK